MPEKPIVIGMPDRPGERGVSLLETMISAFVLVIAVVGLIPTFSVAIQTSEQAGNVSTRCTEYAQDKMEQLMKLSFSDGTTDTTVSPVGTCASGCGLGGAMAPSSTSGSITSAVTYFADYLDENGNLLSSSTGAFYERQWKIATDSTAASKTITVVATALGTFTGRAPSTTLVCIKSSGL
jgi:hypothetical protein